MSADAEEICSSKDVIGKRETWDRVNLQGRDVSKLLQQNAMQWGSFGSVSLFINII